MLTAKRSVLLDRVKHRRVDPTKHYEPFHLPPEAPPPDKKAGKDQPPPAPQALSPPLPPRAADGSVDTARVATLQPRTDESQENVLERLRLWELHVADVRGHVIALW